MKQITILPEDFDSVIPFYKDKYVTHDFYKVYQISSNCPIARAVKRATGSDNVCVDCNGINIDGNEYSYPKNKEINLYDVAKVCERALKNGKARLRLGMFIPVNK